MERIQAHVVVLGGGPGGYPAAIRAAQHGKKVILVEEDFLGGTCLNYGCIPTKSLLASSNVYKKIRDAKFYGISVVDAALHWNEVVCRKDGIVTKLRSGLSTVLQSNGIHVIAGRGKLISSHEVHVSGSTEMTITAEHIVIATGSSVKPFAMIPFDGNVVHDSTSILQCTVIPKSIAIVGAGAIGCEFATLFSEIGSTVFLIEAMPRILPSECPDATKKITSILSNQGITIHTGQKVISYEQNKHGGHVHLEDGTLIDTEIVLVAVGRQLNTKNIGLEEVCIHTHNGAISVNDQMRTNIPHIFAVGDVTAKAMCAHCATHQGLVAADAISNIPTRMSYEAIPTVVYTSPEYASVGLSVTQAREKGIDVMVGDLPFVALGKGVIEGNDAGYARVVVEKGTGRIVGAQIISEKAGDLIAEMAVAITNELTAECIFESIHPHPTYSESWPEAFFIADRMPLNFVKQ